MSASRWMPGDLLFSTAMLSTSPFSGYRPTSSSLVVAVLLPSTAPAAAAAAADNGSAAPVGWPVLAHAPVPLPLRVRFEEACVGQAGPVRARISPRVLRVARMNERRYVRMRPRISPRVFAACVHACMPTSSDGTCACAPAHAVDADLPGARHD